MRRKRTRQRSRTVWVREWIKNRPAMGAYHQLLQELRLTDTDSYRHFLRMDPETFDDLLSKVGPYITYQDTQMRKAISPPERLALTLRFERLLRRMNWHAFFTFGVFIRYLLIVFFNTFFAIILIVK